MQLLPAYYINLDVRLDRRAEMERTLRYAGYIGHQAQRVAALDEMRR